MVGSNAEMVGWVERSEPHQNSVLGWPEGGTSLSAAKGVFLRLHADHFVLGVPPGRPSGSRT